MKEQVGNVIADSNPNSIVDFRCNICGAKNREPLSRLDRESASCTTCGSTVRMRAVMAHLSIALFGEVLPLESMPKSRSLRGIGLSDWVGYAERLAKHLDYTNTYYHQEPRLDITAVPDALLGQLDFVISTDVFEHVARPVERAFDGARSLLKPGGVLILTVPYALEFDHTLEHFPELHDWSLVDQGDGRFELHDRRPDGVVQRYDQLIFHGGPGTTLEFRLFSRTSLLKHLEQAGFSNARIASEPMLAWGIHWPCNWSLPIIARA